MAHYDHAVNHVYNEPETPMSNLPPLNSVKSCPKCGKKYDYDSVRKTEPNPHAITATESAWSGDMPGISYHGTTQGDEWMQRECRMCGYQWHEACADAVPAAPAAGNTVPEDIYRDRNY